ncbi:hypothetical protein CFC21_080823 [Triticum aestivum]|uniref:DUF4220 domain-containing protein n=2 Tax=Triticum aestivum TaxID=4565 RepID=A0A9R1I2Y2_WHEAT|nr:hypothetical protein CFC21_080823 [Triticum aestivum]
MASRAPIVFSGEIMPGRLELLVALWKAWGIQGVVLLSFTLQVMLLVMADIRRRNGSFMLKAIIWSAYVTADPTAMYTLGHMSVMVTSPEHNLMALWAPLLLVHLGGQDNITAYVIEDNRLWMRHLQYFLSQVVAATYVMYESSILGRNTLLRPATILLFVVGILKYGERIWALMCANNCASSSLSATNYKDFRQVSEEQPGTLSKEATSPRDEEDLAREPGRGPIRLKDEEDLQFQAYMMLDVPKQMFEGPTRYVKMNNAFHCEGEDISKMVGMQLSMMYEILYSKAAVVHTWYGRCIRVISLLATIAAFLLFHASSDKLHGGYSRVDVIVTYVLLAGAVVLEITSMLRTIFSTWTCVLLQQLGWRRLSGVLQFLARPIRLVVHTRFWSGSMRQNSLFRTCYRARNNPMSKIARCMGRGDWWDSIVNSSSTYVPRIIIELVVEVVSASEGIPEESPYHIRNSRGRQTLQRCGMHEDLEWTWTVELELDESIIVWNIATELYTFWWRKNRYSDTFDESRERPDILSRYMFYLLATRPYMLPYPVSRQKYVQLCYDLITAHKDVLSALRKEVCDTGFDPANSFPAEAEVIEIDNKMLSSGWRLALKLISTDMGSEDCHGTFKMISKVWAEMLCYTAYRCNENYHAKHLSNGGEILTSIALLMLYMSRKRSPLP